MSKTYVIVLAVAIVFILAGAAVLYWAPKRSSFEKDLLSRSRKHKTKLIRSEIGG